MKRIAIITRAMILVIMLLAPFTLEARKSTYNQLEHHDFIYLSPSAGYYSLIDNTISEALLMNRTDGASFQMGVGYRMYHNHFLFATGINVSYNGSNMLGTDLMVSLPEVSRISMHHDIIHNGEIQIPLMVGAEVKRFYFLIGPKVGFNYYSSVRPNAVVTSLNTQLPVVQNIQTNVFQYSYNLNAALEFGWRLGEVFYGHGADIPQPTTRYYLGLFAEGGALYRVAPEGRSEYYEPTTTQVNGTTVNAVGLYPIYSLDDFKNTHFIHNYTVGVKFTILFEMKSNKYCVVCRDSKKADFSW